MEQSKASPSLSAFLSVGFRPFFLSGFLFAALAMGLWAAFWSPSIDVSSITPFGGYLFWHGHEFIMGFALAIVFGFLLTAVQNWTGLKTTTPFTLTLLLISWIAARFTLFLGNDLPNFAVVILSILPILGATVMIAKPIIKRKLWRNLFAPVALLMMALIDAGSILSVSNNVHPSELFLVAILFISLIISMIGGRVIPMFTANKLGIQKADEPQVIFLLSLLPLPFLMLIQFLGFLPGSDFISSMLCLFLVVGHASRIKIWFHKGILLQPMLWSLWLFYACLPIGFLAMAIKPWMPELASIALHFITVGAISGLISSMVCRVSLGHTGRNIVHDKWIVAAFILLISSLLMRTLFIGIVGFSPALITLSAALFSLTFAILFIRFALIWISPRA